MTHAPPPRRTEMMLKRYRAVVAYFGLMAAVIGAVLLCPLAALVGYPEEIGQAWHFVLPGVLLIAGGGTLYFRLRSDEVTLSVQDGGLIVLLSWGFACLVAVWPLMAVEKLTFTQAAFESVSGWTTTGLSVVDVTQAKKITLLFRSLMQLAGGAGLAIIMLSALTGPVGTGLTSAEGRGEQLVPNVRQSARLVMVIYAAYVFIGTCAYWLAGVGLFDAINHAFCAISTGGFSTQPESIGHWNSVAVEAVTLPLMLLGSLSFLTAYYLWRGRWRVLLRDGELRLVAVVVPAGILLLFLLVCRGTYPTLGKGMRVAVFETVTALTTTGYSTVGYRDWNSFGILLLIVLMVIGGGTYSTGGAMKQFRIYLLFKSIVWEVRRALLPPSAVVENSVWRSGERDYINDARLRQIAAFAALYFLTLAGGTAVMAAHGIPLRDALFEFASTQGTVGLSVGVTSPDLPGLVLWTQMAGMFLGRLEFMVVFASATRLVRDGLFAIEQRR